MRTLRLVGLALGLLTSIAVGSTSAQDAQTQRDRQGIPERVFAWDLPATR